MEEKTAPTTVQNTQVDPDVHMDEANPCTTATTTPANQEDALVTTTEEEKETPVTMVPPIEPTLTTAKPVELVEEDKPQEVKAESKIDAPI